MRMKREKHTLKNNNNMEKKTMLKHTNLIYIYYIFRSLIIRLEKIGRKVEWKWNERWPIRC